MSIREDSARNSLADSVGDGADGHGIPGENNPDTGRGSDRVESRSSQVTRHSGTGSYRESRKSGNEAF